MPHPHKFKVDYVLYRVLNDEEDDEICVVVTGTATPYVPAVYYGDYPQPAEGGEIEDLTVVGKVSGDEYVLTDAETETLTQWLIDQRHTQPDDRDD